MEASRGISNGVYPDLRSSPFHDENNLNSRGSSNNNAYSYQYETGEADLPPNYDEAQSSKNSSFQSNTNPNVSADAPNALPSIYNSKKNGFADSINKLLNKIEGEAKKNLPEKKSDEVKGQPQAPKNEKKHTYKRRDSLNSSHAQSPSLFSLNVDNSKKGVFIGNNNKTVNNNNCHNNNINADVLRSTQRAEPRSTSKTEAEIEAEKKAKKDKEQKEFIFKIIGIASVVIITFGTWAAGKLAARKDVLKEKKETINEQAFNLSSYQEANNQVAGHKDWLKLIEIVSKNQELNDLQKKRNAFELKCVVTSVGGAGISLVGAFFGSMIVVACGGVVMGGTGLVWLYNNSYNKENDKVATVSTRILELIKEARDIDQKLKPAA